MKIFKDSLEFQKLMLDFKRKGKTVGIVPTMGALHAGHISLVKQAKKENQIVAVSIFVNPTQFGPNEDLSKYPRNFEADKKLLEEVGTDFLFFPDVKDIYTDQYATYINIESPFVEKLCGGSRPGHFRGVATIVGMLFLIMQPDRAYFGLKDYQQVLVIKKLVKDLKFPVTIIPLPIIRETDGLAMSSRNQYLSPDERKTAPTIYQTLIKASKKIRKGENNCGAVIQSIKEEISKVPNTRIDYIQITDPETLEDLETINNKNPVLIAIAVFWGKTRLIDNIIVGK